MNHVYSLNKARPDCPTLLTVGTFDGVHRGHQGLLEALVGTAKTLGLQTVVFTFFPHPSVVLHNRNPFYYISLPEEKADLLATQGVDWVITHPFDNQVRKQTPKVFVRNLRKALDFRELWCGPDFALGHQREGNLEWLNAHGPSLGYELRVVDQVKHNGGTISSSRIRRALRSGDVREANWCLGRHLRVTGRVFEVDRRGKTIGFTTANLEVCEERAYPAVGVYACYVWHRSKCFQAVVNISSSPTVSASHESVSIQVHVLDLDADLYGENLMIDFVERLRTQTSSENPEELAIQLRADVTKVGAILEAAESKQPASR